MSWCVEEWPLNNLWRTSVETVPLLLLVYVGTWQYQRVLLGTLGYVKVLASICGYLVIFEDEPFYFCKLCGACGTGTASVVHSLVHCSKTSLLTKCLVSITSNEETLDLLSVQ